MGTEIFVLFIYLTFIVQQKMHNSILLSCKIKTGLPGKPSLPGTFSQFNGKKVDIHL